ncbi:MAG TPA: adenylate kinase [Actinocatenispora sp.]
MSSPRRILVVGSSGAGKSTLARILGERYALPVVHLDRHFWRAGWVAPDRDEWRRACAELAAAGSWVMDGNYGSSLDVRLPRADLIVFPDLSPVVCVARALARRWRYSGSPRPDLPPGCPERVDWQFLRYMWQYRRKHRGRLLTVIADHAPDTPLVRLGSRRAVRAFVSTCSAGTWPSGATVEAAR